MRKQFLALLMSLLAVAFITAAAQTQGAGVDNSTHAALRSVNVVRTDDGVSVEINAHVGLAGVDHNQGGEAAPEHAGESSAGGGGSAQHGRCLCAASH